MALITAQPVRVDDLNKAPDAKNHTIEIDGERVEIDLNDENYARLRAAVDPYLAAGRKVRRSAATPTVAKKGRREQTPEERAQDKAIRAWSASKGEPLSPLGRVPKASREAWVAAGSPTPDAA